MYRQHWIGTLTRWAADVLINGDLRFVRLRLVVGDQADQIQEAKQASVFSKPCTS